MLKMNRPVVWALAFLVAGILLGNRFAFSWFWALASFFACACLYRASRYLPVFLFAAVFAAGFLRVAESNRCHTYAPLEGAEFAGAALDVFYTSGGNRGVVIEGPHPASGEKVRLLAYMRPFQPKPAPGQQIAVRGDMMPLARARNPGGYDQFRHLRPGKIDATMWPEWAALGETGGGIRVASRRARDMVAGVFDSLLPRREAGVIKAMLLGDRSELDPALADMYRVMGIFHILSISGLHVAILMMAAQKALGVFMPQRRAAFFALLFMVFYCAMTGAAVPTVRAVAMGAVSVFGKIIFRDYEPVTALSWAAAALLLYEPLYLWGVGFQLSFGAVYGIALMKEPISRALVKLRGESKLNGGLAVGVAAVVSTNVVFAYHFYEINTYSLLGNLVIAPTVTLLLVLGLVTGLAGLVWMPLAGVLAGGLYYILRFYEMSAEVFGALPLAMLPTGGGNLAVAAAGFLALASFVWWFHGFGPDFSRRSGGFFLSVVALAAAALLHLYPPGPRLTALDTEGGYLVVRYRGETFVTGRLAGGERDVAGFLARGGARRATLVLAETPGPNDAWRLGEFGGRVRAAHYPADASRIAASLFAAAAADANGQIAVSRMGENGALAAGRLEIKAGEILYNGRRLWLFE